jgi:sodium/potassium/calcium exchanger 6
VLPPPEQIVSTLFPTLCGWSEENVWQKIIGLISAPSVLLLTITLPVIETSRDDDDNFRDDDIPDLSLPGAVSSQDTIALAKTAARRDDSNTPLLSGQRSSGHASGSDEHGLSGHGDVATVAVSAERHREHAYPEERAEPLSDHEIVGSPEEMPTTKDDVDPNDWNRWLVIIQMFAAPLFMVLIVWANTNQEHPQALIRPTLISLLISCVGLLIILTLTTPMRPPRWRIVLCLVGFAVSIAWISSIANEVVGVLKALGVILNISDAILGLTIFAVGNSCGDLVANITVAKLGYPVMALSACFGGPMLNILLGIGLSGVYLILTAAGNRVDKHPDKKWKLKPYHIDISKTLLISGATLLVTLLILLILVPWKSWKMDRSLGWILIAIWLVSTAANVGVELSGVGTSSTA